MNSRWNRVWGEAIALFHGAGRFRWIDVVIVVGLAGLLGGLVDIASQWTGPHRLSVDIDLSPWSLPEYTFFSLSRGLIAYGISLLFTLVYGYWAAKDALASRILIPLLDILQSVPVLAFLPGLLWALSAAFPDSNIGLELAAIVMIFTGQAWNMTFSFYHSLRSLPIDQDEAATAYRFSWWQRLKWVELPFSTMGLVWNSMMSMAGGWFFLMINEAYQMGDKDFRLPGVGSYMSVAVDEGRVDAMLWAMLAILVMIVALDQLLWRPVVVWAQKFRVEEGGDTPIMTSWFLNWLRHSRIASGVAMLSRRFRKWLWRSAAVRPNVHFRSEPAAWGRWLSIGTFVAILLVLTWGSWKMLGLLHQVSIASWIGTLGAAGVTLLRVSVSTAVGTLWALPAGLAIGLSPRLSRIFQPVIQVAASFPAPLLFPLVIAGLQITGVPLGVGSILLMLLGTQWYILFNVIAGAMAVPADLREAARSFRLNRWKRFRTLYFPAVFPYLITGWVTAAGGAWNSSIVAEYVTFRGVVHQTWGLGGQINAATSEEDFPMLAASVLMMSSVVVLFNRVVWRRLYDLAQRRYSLSK